MKTHPELEKHGIVFYDGQCGMCQHAVQFILRHDHKSFFYFAALQSQWFFKFYPEMYEKFKSSQNFETMVYFEKGVFFERSTAALKISRKLQFPFKFLYIFIIVPGFIRDGIYKIIAKNRHKWTTYTECPIPTTEEKNRFLNDF